MRCDIQTDWLGAEAARSACAGESVAAEVAKRKLTETTNAIIEEHRAEIQRTTERLDRAMDEARSPVLRLPAGAAPRRAQAISALHTVFIDARFPTAARSRYPRSGAGSSAPAAARLRQRLETGLA